MNPTVETKSIDKATAVATAVAPLGSALRKEGILKRVAPETITPSLTNPRKTFDTPDWPEFVASIQAQGVVQPPVVRSLKITLKEPGAAHGWRVQRNGYEWEEFPKTQEAKARALFEKFKAVELELVCGERRWRAAKEVGLKTMPVVVQELTHEEVTEIQQVENLQREDLSPLEEAKGYEVWLKRLVKPWGACESKDKAVEYIAGRVGKKRSTIYAKLAVLKTNKTAQEALQKGEIDISKAGLLAQILDAAQQTEALRKFIKGEWNGGPMSFRQARQYVEEHYRKKLSAATWKLDDAELIHSAGPCTTCLLRTGNIPEADGDPDVCTSPSCFERKRQAVLEARKKEYLAKGMRVLSEAEGQKILPYQDNYIADRSYAKLSQVCDRDPKRRTYEQLLGKDAPAPVFVPNDGKLVQLRKVTELNDALKKKGKFAKKSKDEDKSAKVRKAREKLGAVLEPKVFEKLCQLPSDPKTEKKFWALVVADYAENYYGDANIEAIIGVKGTLPGNAEKLEKFSLEQLRAAAAAFVMYQNQGIVEQYSGAWSETFEQLCDLAGVDLKKEEKAAALAEAKPSTKPEQLKLSRKAGKAKK